MTSTDNATIVKVEIVQKGGNWFSSTNNYIFDPDNLSDNMGRFSILKGVFIFTSGLLTKASRPDVKIETPVILIVNKNVIIRELRMPMP